MPRDGVELTIPSIPLRTGTPEQGPMTTPRMQYHLHRDLLHTIVPHSVVPSPVAAAILG